MGQRKKNVTIIFHLVALITAFSNAIHLQFASRLSLLSTIIIAQNEYIRHFRLYALLYDIKPCFFTLSSLSLFLYVFFSRRFKVKKIYINVETVLWGEFVSHSQAAQCNFHTLFSVFLDLPLYSRYGIRSIARNRISYTTRLKHSFAQKAPQ